MTPDGILKLSLAVGALLAGAGVGYYYGVFLPGEAIRETVRAGEQRQVHIVDHTADLERERRAEEQRQAAVQQRYQVCVAGADAAYKERWTSGCRAQHARQQAAFEDCADNLFATRSGCARKFPVEPEIGCALPAQIGGRLAAAREAAKGQCLGEMRGGVSADPVASPTAGL